MEGPLISTDFPFGTMRGPWFPSVEEEDMTNWNEWMQYDPAVASQTPQNIEAKSAHGQPLLFTRRQQPQSQAQSQTLQPTSVPPTTSAITTTATTTATATANPVFADASGAPFTFGQNIDLSPAFDFSGNTLSSPPTGDVPPQNGFFQPSMWDQQPQQVTENSIFTPQAYKKPGFAAPPAPASTPSLHHSPSSINNGRASSSSSHSSPEPAIRSKKRKSRSEDEEHESVSSGKKEKNQPPKKTAHNMIEKRYRTNLNDKIAALRDSVPSLRVMSRPNGTEEDDDPEDLEGLTPAHKLNKATVLSKATEYIRHLEKRAKRLQDELTTVQGRLEGYEKMTMAGQMGLHTNHASTPEGTRYREDPFAPAHGLTLQGPAQGMIPVPENIAALQRGLPPQQHYAHAYPQYGNAVRPAVGPPMVNGRRGSALMGKLMVGSLAGLMILEGLVERESSQREPADRGLFALPIHLASVLAPRVSFGPSTAQIPLAKFFLVLLAFFYLVAPLLDFKPKPKPKGSPILQLAAVPSLACPVEVRRKAWLTAIQTVWVPQHNFILEAAALGLKTLKLSTRKIIGWPGYVFLTGITREQEAARIKAWEIALDAQLTGGDAEISMSRLLLTLMASGTLPDTPARLMLKALHIRVLLWEVAKPGHGSWWMVNELSAKMARSYWNYARSEHRIAVNMMAKHGADVNPLPEHLAALIEKECDDVLKPAIVQRAYNLAWNRSSAENTTTDSSMDGVVEDSSICSPLDALAAWYSSLALKKGIASMLATRTGSMKESIISDLNLAVRSAPPNSQAQVRALVAQAVVLDDDRTTRIISALHVLPSAIHRANGSFSRLVGQSSVAIDVRQALTFAKCLSLIETSSLVGRQRAISAVNNILLTETSTTLLSFAAAHKVLMCFMQNTTLQAETSSGLERIASSLRRWVGHDIGKRSGLSNKIRSTVIESCLDASKTLVGLAEQKVDADIDDGYVSSSAKDD